MKTVGRGRDYQKALADNLLRSLQVHKKIRTTARRAKLVRGLVSTKLGEEVRLTPITARRGDNAPQVLVEVIKKDNENTTDTTVEHRKKVAPR